MPPPFLLTHWRCLNSLRVPRLDSGTFQCLNLWKNTEVPLLGLWNFLDSNGISSQTSLLASLLKVMNNLTGAGSTSFTKSGMCDPFFLKLRQGKSPSSSKYSSSLEAELTKGIRGFLPKEREPTSAYLGWRSQPPMHSPSLSWTWALWIKNRREQGEVWC